MMRNFFLRSRARRAAVLGWTLTVPLIVWLFVFGAPASQIPENFGEIFSTLGLPPSPTMGFFLRIGGVGVACLYGCLALLPVAVLLLVRRSWPKIVAPLACGAAAWVLNVVFCRAFLTAILQIMEKVGA